MSLNLSLNATEAAVALIVALGASPVAAQTTYRACRVPGVGAIYMIGEAGLPTGCLETTHVEFTWIEGGDGSITTAQLADGAVTQAKLDPGITLGVGPGDIGTTELADMAVTSAKIADGTITAADIASNTITSAQIADGTIGPADVADNSLTADDLAPNSVTGSELADGAVSASKIVPGAVTSAEIADGAIGVAKLSAAVRVPLAWGNISSNGTVNASSGNISTVSVSSGAYTISFTDLTYDATSYVTIATRSGLVDPGFIQTRAACCGDLVVTLWLFNAATENGDFSFVIF